MELDGISGILERASIPPADFTNLTTEWNGKGVQAESVSLDNRN